MYANIGINDKLDLFVNACMRSAVEIPYMG